LHNTHIPAKAKEVIYRWLFNMTPITQIKAHKDHRIYPCKLCRQNIHETKDHIYFHCQTVGLAVKTLKGIIQKHTKTQVDIYQAIMLNMILKMETKMATKLFRCLGEYKLLVWICKNKNFYENSINTPELFHKIFEHKLEAIQK
jgi:hypothetical protein